MICYYYCCKYRRQLRRQTNNKTEKDRDKEIVRKTETFREINKTFWKWGGDPGSETERKIRKVASNVTKSSSFICIKPADLSLARHPRLLGWVMPPLCWRVLVPLVVCQPHLGLAPPSCPHDSFRLVSETRRAAIARPFARRRETNSFVMTILRRISFLHGNV